MGDHLLDLHPFIAAGLKILPYTVLKDVYKRQALVVSGVCATISYIVISNCCSKTVSFAL